MSARTEHLSRRRRDLLARSELDRRRFAQAAAQLDRELESIDRVIARARGLARPAVLVAGIGSLLYFARTNRFKLLSRGFFVYAALRRLIARI